MSEQKQSKQQSNRVKKQHLVWQQELPAPPEKAAEIARSKLCQDGSGYASLLCSEACQCSHLNEWLPHLLDLSFCKPASQQPLLLKNPIHALHLSSQLEDNSTVIEQNYRNIGTSPWIYGEEQQRAAALSSAGIPEVFFPLTENHLFHEFNTPNPNAPKPLHADTVVMTPPSTGSCNDKTTTGGATTSSSTAVASTTPDKTTDSKEDEKKTDATTSADTTKTENADKDKMEDKDKVTEEDDKPTKEDARTYKESSDKEPDEVKSTTAPSVSFSSPVVQDHTDLKKEDSTQTKSEEKSESKVESEVKDVEMKDAEQDNKNSNEDSGKVKKEDSESKDETTESSSSKPEETKESDDVEMKDATEQKTIDEIKKEGEPSERANENKDEATDGQKLASSNDTKDLNAKDTAEEKNEPFDNKDESKNAEKKHETSDITAETKAEEGVKTETKDEEMKDIIIDKSKETDKATGEEKAAETDDTEKMKEGKADDKPWGEKDEEMKETSKDGEVKIDAKEKQGKSSPSDQTSNSEKEGNDKDKEDENKPKEKEDKKPGDEISKAELNPENKGGNQEEPEKMAADKSKTDENKPGSSDEVKKLEGIKEEAQESAASNQAGGKTGLEATEKRADGGAKPSEASASQVVKEDTKEGNKPNDDEPDPVASETAQATESKDKQTPATSSSSTTAVATASTTTKLASAAAQGASTTGSVSVASAPRYLLSEPRYMEISRQEDQIIAIRKLLANRTNNSPAKKTKSKKRKSETSNPVNSALQNLPGNLQYCNERAVTDLTPSGKEEWLQTKATACRKVEGWLEQFRSSRRSYWEEESMIQESNTKKQKISSSLSGWTSSPTLRRSCQLCKTPRATGDEIMQCLECSFIGCGPASVCRSSKKQHILQHLFLSGHKFGELT